MVDLEKANRKSTEERKRQKKTRNAYWAKVVYLTKKTAHLLPGIEKRGWHSWHIDHVVPIAYGFRNSIPPEVIADISNLRMMPAEENRKKGTKYSPASS